MSGRKLKLKLTGVGVVLVAGLIIGGIVLRNPSSVPADTVINIDGASTWVSNTRCAPLALTATEDEVEAAHEICKQMFLERDR